MEKDSKVLYPQLFKLSKDGFPVGGWAEPLPDFAADGQNVITRENYNKIRECGFDFVCSIYALFPDDSETVKRQLDAAEGTGVKLFISDAAVQKEPITEDNLKKNYVCYKDKQAFLGYLVKDEPGSKMFSELSERKKMITNILGDVPLYYNLLPTYSTGFMLENGYWSNEAPIIECDKQSYIKYVKDFIDIVKPSFLSYDFYPFASDGSIYKDYFFQLSIASNSSADAKIPFIPFVQCCSFNRFSRNPLESEVMWQANTSVAYGARGLQYFTLWSPIDSEFERFEGCIFGKHGEITKRYEEVKKLNHFIKRAGTLLSEYAFKGIALSGFTPAPVPEKDIRDFGLILSGDVIAGCFENKLNKNAFYAVCNKVSGQSEISISIGNDKKYKIISEEGEKVCTGKIFSGKLNAGEALLITEI